MLHFYVICDDAGMRIGFGSSTYSVYEDIGNASVCARVYEFSGSIPYTQVTMRTSPTCYGEISIGLLANERTDNLT